MTQAFHTAVWIDHDEANIARLHIGHADHIRIRAASRAGNLHHRAGTPGVGHRAPDQHYLAAVSKALEGAGRILIVGPGSAKNELAAHIKDRLPHLAAHIAGVEAMDQASDAELEHRARSFFRRDDLMPGKP